MKTKKLLPVGTRVKLVSPGPYIWDVAPMKNNTFKDVFGVIVEYQEKGSRCQGLDLYSRQTGEQLRLSFGEPEPWRFDRSNFVREKEPKK